MIRAVVATASAPRPSEPKWRERLLEQLASLPARLRSAALRLTFLRPIHKELPERPAAVVGMITAILWGGPYCGDEISVPSDAPRLTRPDGSVYLRSSLTDSGGRPVFMLRLGRRSLDLPRQSDLS